jgi:NTP pyrophosphatase (non-canonical NTP hydrolase)
MSASHDLLIRCESAQRRYGDLASTHEALGVALEEWDELRDAIRSNNIIAIRNEALDLAAVLVRLAEHCDKAHLLDMATAFAERSMK